MSNYALMETFLRASEAWLCDGYSTVIRYIGEPHQSGKGQIWDASIELNPLPPVHNLSFCVVTPRVVVGQFERAKSRKSDILKVLTAATAGKIEVPGHQLGLIGDGPFDYHSDLTLRDSWFSPLHLEVIGTEKPQLPNIDLVNTDHALRRSTPPFDGLSDAARWLGLATAEPTSARSSIQIRINPPVDLIFDECSLTNNRLELTLHAHPKFDVKHIGVAVRALPGAFLDGRRQVAGEIQWGRVRNGRRPGVGLINIADADNVLVMLLIKDSTVRRYWLIDPEKARNNRFLAVQHFDKELRMTKQAVLESPDPTKFERGIAALLFLMGFTPSMQIETDAPDLIVTTPGGKLAIVECTLRVSDFVSKVGKLVDRRVSLSKHLTAVGHPVEVAAVLICRLPRDQIAALADEPSNHNVVLLTGEDIQAAFDGVRALADPDTMLESAITNLRRRPIPGLA